MGLLAMGLSGLGLTGLGIDVIRHAAQPASKAPAWPWGFSPPAGWSPMDNVLLVAGGILAFAVLRSLLSGYYNIAMGVLLQGQIVVDLRARVYDKLQRLSFRFFDDNAQGPSPDQNIGLDNLVIQSVQNVPEPASMSLLALGALALLKRKRA
ncbi:MAG: PEP-CTERM sorting domain-containing protein [Planctomycetota bacterium]|nr:PEP-CTERM sorting domain-containing protein [Planctomycetota bacterium]